MKRKSLIGIVAVMVSLGLGTLYVKDTKAAGQAVLVRSYLIDHRASHGEYPTSEKVEARFPTLFASEGWYYWPGETLTNATFQYPMSLPLANAPGQSKISEFFPIIYAYSVRDPGENN